ncbi:MAG: hypothetical protein CM1200mP36_02010 [Gammaproteobacteria bacterium]|nr:MAG: hypothetical protein CM1200mP36_02010 [Gammaproteobacteria bacterium]
MCCECICAGRSQGALRQRYSRLPRGCCGTEERDGFVQWEYAYGWLRTETGVHRLVRKSPFDAGHRRHTSFAAVFVSPEFEEKIDFEFNPSDLRVDVYRASGAGGQHVNKTESAVGSRTCLPELSSSARTTGLNTRTPQQPWVSLRQSLRARTTKAPREADMLEEGKADIGWGSQIRSYVLDQSRIKDLRTGFESGNPGAILDGDLDAFLEESLSGGCKDNG